MLDLLILIIFGIFIMVGYKKGFLSSIYEFITLALSMLGTKLLFPLVNRAIRVSGLVYEPIKDSVIKSLNLQNVVTENTIKAQNNLISKLDLPKFIVEKLNENNNFEVYKILNVSSIEEYIGGYIANLIVNIFVSIIVFLLIMLLLKGLGFSFGIVKRLPLLRNFDDILGATVGFFKGVIVVWIVFVFLTFFIAKYPDSGVNQQLENSNLALGMYENNLFLKMISNVTK